VAIAGLSIRSYFDHHVPEQFAIDLRRREFDALMAREVGNERASDEAHLDWATTHGRVVLTSDFDDYPILASKWFLEGREHAGIILLEQPRWTSYGELLRRLLRLLDTLTADDMINRVEWLDHRWSDKPGSD
jgi:predicted nuclease of predicted toxin-antitoxin system